VRHADAVATLLSDGRVLLDGGAPYVDGGAPYAGAEIYDPVAGTFTFAGLGTDPSQNSPVAAALLTNGEVLQTLGAACADCDATHDAELFDPSTSGFSATPRTQTSLLFTPLNDTATLLPDGSVLTIGGQAELFDPVADTFNPTGRMTLYRDGPTATLLADGRVLVGRTREAICPARLPKSTHHRG
jgi:hypothetical protein